MTKHTPGPWRKITTAGCVREITGATDIATRCADARLISAAPDLLKELKNLQAIICESCGPIDYDTNCTEHSDACYQATLAIEKAEGKV